jgi:hypothetical protein
MFSTITKSKYLAIRGFLAQNKEFPNFYLEARRLCPFRASRRAKRDRGGG